jgi:hypothetical protein
MRKMAKFNATNNLTITKINKIKRKIRALSTPRYKSKTLATILLKTKA